MVPCWDRDQTKIEYKQKTTSNAWKNELILLIMFSQLT